MLLPALPSALGEQGSGRGLRARGDERGSFIFVMPCHALFMPIIEMARLLTVNAVRVRVEPTPYVQH